MTEQLRIWAGLAGVMNAVTLITLLLFFAMATPFGTAQPKWFWLGGVNDWLSVLAAGPWIVATVLLAVRAQLLGAWWILTGAVIVGIAALAILTLTMLAGWTSLGLQSTVSVPVVVLAFVWAAIALHAAAGRAVVPGWVATFALVLVIGLVVGAAVIGVSFLVPEGPARVTLWIIGLVPGGLAWVGYPALWLCVASTAK